MQLSFEYDSRKDCSVAEYRGLTIKALRDCSPENPWKAWDGNAPCISLSFDHGRAYVTEYDKDAGCNLLRPFDHIGATVLRRHMAAICSAFDAFDVYNSWGGKLSDFASWLQSEALDNQASYGGSLTEHKAELLQEALDGMRESDRLECLQSIYSAIGWPALCTSTSGYSQGDYIELLFVITPQFAKAMGMENRRKYTAESWQKDMLQARDLFGAWAWGDVYGFAVEQDGETLDSCWGFYGADFDESGLASAAIESAEHMLASAAKRRQARLAELIRHKVPLALRPAELAKASAPEG